jgi:hypothetical protein
MTRRWSRQYANFGRKAAYPHGILVGALDPNGNAWAGSNRPQTNTPGYLYTWQRGVAVPTQLADGTKVFATGTSFAAPVETAHVLNRSPSYKRHNVLWSDCLIVDHGRAAKSLRPCRDTRT